MLDTVPLTGALVATGLRRADHFWLRLVTPVNLSTTSSGVAAADATPCIARRLSIIHIINLVPCLFARRALSASTLHRDCYRTRPASQVRVHLVGLCTRSAPTFTFMSRWLFRKSFEYVLMPAPCSRHHVQGFPLVATDAKDSLLVMEALVICLSYNRVG